MTAPTCMHPQAKDLFLVWRAMLRGDDSLEIHAPHWGADSPWGCMDTETVMPMNGPLQARQQSACQTMSTGAAAGRLRHVGRYSG